MFYVFCQCPDSSQMSFQELNAWIWVPWMLSIIWIGRHIWIPKSRRLASTEQMFGTPYYCGLMIDNSMVLNRRSDSGTTEFNLDSSPTQPNQACHTSNLQTPGYFTDGKAKCNSIFFHKRNKTY